MDTPRFLTLAEALLIYRDQITRYGGDYGARSRASKLRHRCAPGLEPAGQTSHQRRYRRPSNKLQKLYFRFAFFLAPELRRSLGLLLGLFLFGLRGFPGFPGFEPRVSLSSTRSTRRLLPR